jgi:hypothetical protein
MSSFYPKLLVTFILCTLAVCQLPGIAISAPARAATATSGKNAVDLQTRNNALALLHDLLNDEKHLSKVLVIKRESSDLDRLVKSISKTANDGVKLLESTAKHIPDLNLAALNLPPGEAAARKAIAKAKEHQLLHSKDGEFEVRLLLSQIQALNYGSCLAQVAADNEPQADRARKFSALAAQLKDLYDQVAAMVKSQG